MKKTLVYLLPLFCYLLAAEPIYTSPFANDSALIIKSFIKSLVIVIVLLVLFFYWRKYLLPKTGAMLKVKSNMKIVDKLHVDYGTIVYLLEVGDCYQLMTVSNKRISYGNAFKKDELKLNLPEVGSADVAKPDFLKIFNKLLNKKAAKESKQDNQKQD